MLPHGDGIVMLEYFFLDALLIQKCAITALEILNKIIIALLRDLGVKARYRQIVDDNIVLGIPPYGNRSLLKKKLLPNVQHLVVLMTCLSPPDPRADVPSGG